MRGQKACVKLASAGCPAGRLRIDASGNLDKCVIVEAGKPDVLVDPGCTGVVYGARLWVATGQDNCWYPVR